MISLKRVGTSLLCCLLCILPVMGDPQASGQRAGQIDAMIPAATVNSQTAQTKEALQWNDLLATADSGRVRAGLSDGSLLSLGSNSELRIVQHDAASQQTSLELSFGKVRSQVVKITKPGGKFQMTTPNAVIGVVGTDFYAAYTNTPTNAQANGQTTVICYSGHVIVTPTRSAQILQNGGQSSGGVTLGPGQMVVVTSVVAAAGLQVTQATTSQINGSISETGVSLPGSPVLARGGHGLRNGLIVTGIALGVGLGVGLGEQGNKTGGRCPPTSGNCD